MKTIRLLCCTGFALILLFLTNNASAQFVSAELGVDGLTCSACTRSVEMSIRKLDFVKDVQMNLDNTNGIITFKPRSKISIDKLARAVVDAGFSVRYLQATYGGDSASHIFDTCCFTYGDATYQLVKVTLAELKPGMVFKFIGKEYQTSKEYKPWQDYLKPVCRGTKKVYYVIL